MEIRLNLVMTAHVLQITLEEIKVFVCLSVCLSAIDWSQLYGEIKEISKLQTSQS